MEGCLVSRVRSLRNLPADQIVNELDDALIKSLLNILFNICFTRAIVLTRTQRIAFKAYDRLCIDLLDVEKDLEESKKLLARNPELVRLIAETCPAE